MRSQSSREWKVVDDARLANAARRGSVRFLAENGVTIDQADSIEPAVLTVADVDPEPTSVTERSYDPEPS